MEENIYIIEQYIAGELKGKALEDFEEKLQNDPDFAADVKISQALHKHVSKKNVDFLEAVKEADEAYHTKPETTQQAVPQSITRVRFMRRLLAAASILLLVAAGWWLISQNLSTPEQVFAEYYEKYAPDTMMSGRSSYEKLLKEGHKKLGEGQLDEAIADFDKIITGTDISIPIKAYAKIYKALAYLRSNNLGAFKKELDEIEHDNYVEEMKDKAKKLLNDVNKLQDR